MKASKIEHKGENRIKVEFPYNQEIASLLGQIPDARWSQTMKAWHIPYSKMAFTKLTKLFPEIEYPKKVTDVKAYEPVIKTAVPVINRQNKPNKNVSVEVAGRRILLKLPKNALDTHFITSFRHSRWDGKQFCWIVPNYPENLDLIKDYFNDRIRELIVHEDFEVKTSSDSVRRIKTNELLLIKTNNGRLKLIFAFNKPLSYIIKEMPFNYWDTKNKWWTIPYSEKFLHDIKNTAKSQSFNILYEEEPKCEEKTRRMSPFDVPDYRRCPEEYLRKLVELRYTKNTIRSYTTLFEEFINYYHNFDIEQINEKMIIAFLQYLVMDRKISPSYQNQSINAIKFYYERVLGGKRKIYTHLVERPRREKTLPVVLNETEMTNTIRQVKNIKHKAIIMLTYSSGLRLSELLNLKIKDIDSKRMQVFVRQAKGRKDRYTLLSKKVLPVLRQYFEEYKPKEWLFEGAKGKQYSESSVQTIVKEAYQRAGIKKKVSTHTLRHCFATHLLENGTDLRYIQVLMGHASSKTTEIYTHVTTKGFDQIKNPLDNLDLE
ncbi:MAG: site-specific integrase [Bacteroidetes bacterium]|nr:site-specific integrase [Bacteroidota bacterium]